MRTLAFSLLAAAVLLCGCQDKTTAPRDLTPPAAPRGLFSVTGDGGVSLTWLGNTESDLAGYRVYMADCASGGTCPYTRVGTAASPNFVVSGLVNGQTHYFAVSAVDRAGNESALSYADVFDTPRPAGTGLALNDASVALATSGYDFSTYTVRPGDDAATDMYFQVVGGVAKMICPFSDTDIQDAGYATTLDAVDFAPLLGWSATGSVELISGHCYVVRIGTTVANYAKFRVTGLSATQVVLDWAYQTAPGNQELHASPAGGGTARVRRSISQLSGLLPTVTKGAAVR